MRFKERVYNLSNKQYLLLVLLIQISALCLSFFNLFEYERCTEIIPRELNLFNFNFELIYPKMCDEPFYFQGFQWFYSIYEYGYVYQDRPLYLLIGFILYRFFYFLFYLLQFTIDPISVLLLTSLVFQIAIINFITYFVNLIIIKKHDRVYFIIYFLILLFSFEQRKYLFLPSSSTLYFFIFVFSIYSIQTRKLNGLIFGLLFTISGYGIIGFIYLLMINIFYRRNFRNILLNICLFLIPSLFFELTRISLGYIRGPQGGVRYIYSSEAYQQFVWFFKSFFNDYVPLNSCQTLNNFLNCYFNQTTEFFRIMKNYQVILIILLLASAILKKNQNKQLQIDILLFTLFSYTFISFQGYYGFRIVYYSLGFSLFLFICLLIFNINDLIISSLTAAFIGLYTLSRNSNTDYFEFLNFSNQEYFLLFMIIIFLTKNIYKKFDRALRIK